MMDVNTLVLELRSERSETKRNDFISQYDSFVLGCVSKATGRYVSKKSDDEYIVGLEAFNEAIDRYDNSKGGFLHFASLLIRSRVIDYLRKEVRVNGKLVSNEELLLAQPVKVNESLADEIRVLRDELSYFGIKFEELSGKSPVHATVKKELGHLAFEMVRDVELVEVLYSRKKLPMKEISLKYMQPLKRVKRFRDYIITLIIVDKEELCEIKSWLGTGGS